MQLEDNGDQELSRTSSKWKAFKGSFRAARSFGNSNSDKLQVNTDINDFLRPQSREDVSHPPPLANPLVNHNLVHHNSGEATGTGSRPTTAHSAISQPGAPKSRRHLGLHVQFAAQAPEIIGEGGDEAELPSSQVKSGWVHAAHDGRQHVPPHQAAYTDEPSQTHNIASNEVVASQAESERGNTLVRRPEVDKGLRRRPVNLRPLDQHTPRPLPSPRILPKSLDIGDDGDEGQDLPANLIASPPRKPVAAAREWSSERYGNVPQKPIDPPRIQSIQLSQESVQTAARSAPNIETQLQDVSLRDPFPKPHPDLLRGPPLKQLPHTSHPDLASRGPSLDIPPQKPDLGEPLSRQAMSTEASPPDADKPSPSEYLTLVSPHPEAKTATAPQPGWTTPNRRSIDLECLEQFSEQMQSMYRVFQLSADSTSKDWRPNIEDWLRAATWWLQSSKIGLEQIYIAASKDKSASQLSNSTGTRSLDQVRVDLAKTCWIMKDKVRSSTDKSQLNDGIREAISLVDASLVNLLILRKKDFYSNSTPLLQQGMDTRIWIPYPEMDPRLEFLLGTPSRSRIIEDNPMALANFSGMPLADTRHYFAYGCMFVNAQVVLGDEDARQPEILQLSCALTIMRPRSDSGVEITITSQDGFVALHVASDAKNRLKWASAQWKVKTHMLVFSLDREVQLVIRMREQDFKTLWGIYDYTLQLRNKWKVREGEEIQFDEEVPSFHYVDGAKNSGGFPSQPVKGCRVRLLHKHDLAAEGTGMRRFHQGHRLVVITPPGVKTVGCINQELGHQKPILFDFLRGDGNAPALLLKDVDEKTVSSIVITFVRAQARTDFLTSLDGTLLDATELSSEEIPLDNLEASRVDDQESAIFKPLLFPPGIKWRCVRVMNEVGVAEKGKHVLSSHFRICIFCEYGVITDRVNLRKQISHHGMRILLM